MSLFCGKQQGIPLKNEHFEFIATQIIKIFPTENVSIYYCPPKTEGPQQKISKGKLVDSYRNKLRDCRKCGIINKKRKRSQNDEEIESEEDAEFSREEKVFDSFQLAEIHHHGFWYKIIGIIHECLNKSILQNYIIMYIDSLKKACFKATTRIYFDNYL